MRPSGLEDLESAMKRVDIIEQRRRNERFAMLAFIAMIRSTRSRLRTVGALPDGRRAEKGRRDSEFDRPTAATPRREA